MVTAALLLFSAGSLFVALTRREPTTESPKPDTITYLFDADNGKAQWVTFDSRLDGYTSQFFEGRKDSSVLRGYFPFNTERLLVAAAPHSVVQNPALELLGDTVSDSVRTLRLRIHSQRDAYEISVVVDTSVQIFGAEVNGRPFINAVRYIPELGRFIPARRGPWMLDIYGAGFELELRTKRGERIPLTLIERSSGIPEPVMHGFSPRPDWTMPRPFYPSDGTMIRKTFWF